MGGDVIKRALRKKKGRQRDKDDIRNRQSLGKNSQTLGKNVPNDGALLKRFQSEEKLAEPSGQGGTGQRERKIKTKDWVD